MIPSLQLALRARYRTLTFTANLAEVDAFIVEDLDAMGPVVRDEDLLAVVDHDAVGELQVLGAPELVQDVAGLVEDDNAHHFALHHDDPALVVHGHPAGVLQNVGTKFADELAVLVINLDLKFVNFSLVIFIFKGKHKTWIKA